MFNGTFNAPTAAPRFVLKHLFERNNSQLSLLDNRTRFRQNEFRVMSHALFSIELNCEPSSQNGFNSLLHQALALRQLKSYSWLS